MGSKVETVKEYSISVAQRAIGWDAFQKKPQERLVSRLIDCMGQITFPALSRLMSPLGAERIGSKSSVREKLKFFGRITIREAGLMPDLGLWMIVLAASDNPLEILPLRLAANAATQIGFDVISAGIDKIKSFRPSANTLAV